MHRINCKLYLICICGDFSFYFSFQKEGRKHDASMLADSNLLEELQRRAFSPTGQAMSVYGDPAWRLNSRNAAIQ